MPIAILSVYNKTGIIEFAQGLASLGWTLLASGGTAALLRDNNILVTEVADYTKSPDFRRSSQNPASRHSWRFACPSNRFRSQRTSQPRLGLH